MGKGADQIQIYKPRTLREVMNLLKEYPGIGFVAGGTDFMRQLKIVSRAALPGGTVLPGGLIALGAVDELTKIRRKENTIEIGAAVPLERIISLGPNVVPPLLLSVLSQIATPAVRNLATLGGNLALASPFCDALLPLALLEARCEIRRLGTHLSLPLARFIKAPGRTSLEPFAVLVGVSVPVPRWSIRVYVKLDPITGPEFSLLKFAALARVYRSTVADFRLSWGGVDPLLLRNREIEALVIGAKIPFPPKLLSQCEESVAALIASAPPTFLPAPYHRHCAVRLARDFLEKVGSYRE